MRRILADPLLHFVVLGAILFAFWELSNSRGRGERTVVVSAKRAASLLANFEGQNGRVANEREARELMMLAADSEILRREAKRLGFAEHDPIVQRRLAQKMRFVLEDAASVPEASDAELQHFLDEHEHRYKRPETLSFVHVFLADAKLDEIHSVGERLASGEEVAQLGVAFAHGRRFDARSQAQVRAAFGASFAQQVMECEPGRWQRVTSIYGAHWVRVTSRTDARAALLDEVRVQVREAWIQAQREEILAREMAALREDYEVQLPSAGEVKAAQSAGAEP